MNFYYQISDILRIYNSKNIQIKNLWYKYKNNKDFSKIYRVVYGIIDNKKIVEEIFNFINLKEEINNEHKNIFLVLIFEMFISKKIKKMGGKQIKILKTYKNEINNKYDFTLDDKINIKKYIRPNFVNYDIKYIDELLNNFKYKWILENKLIELDYNDYSLINKNTDFIKENSFIVQSKSSCLPVFNLRKYFELETKGQVIIDSCASPGNKTLQLMTEFPDAIILAFEKNKDRYELLNSRLNKFNKENFAKYFTFNCDFLSINLKEIEEKYGKIIAAVCDPSCSGSGMLERKNNIINLEDTYKNLNESETTRINNLKNFQVKILQKLIDHKIDYISYSTCSIYLEENEEVITNILSNNEDYNIIKISNNSNMGIKSFNNKNYNELVENCIRIEPKQNESDGFFVSLLKFNK